MNSQLNLPFKAIKNHHFFLELSSRIVDNFWQYHFDNPKVYELFKKFSIQLKNTGRKHYGVGAVMERIRWHFAVETVGDAFKINNNYRSCYARLLAIEQPEFLDFFETRKNNKHYAP